MNRMKPFTIERHLTLARKIGFIWDAVFECHDILGLLHEVFYKEGLLFDTVATGPCLSSAVL